MSSIFVVDTQQTADRAKTIEIVPNFDAVVAQGFFHTPTPVDRPLSAFDALAYVELTADMKMRWTTTIRDANAFETCKRLIDRINRYMERAGKEDAPWRRLYHRTETFSGIMLLPGNVSWKKLLTMYQFTFEGKDVGDITKLSPYHFDPTTDPDRVEFRLDPDTDHNYNKGV